MAKNILKEAIADAKDVREVALANAKAALTESFDQKLQTMLSVKLSEELDGELDEEIHLDEYTGMEDLDKPAGLGDALDSLGAEEDDIFEMEGEGEDAEIDLEEILSELELEEDLAEETVAEGEEETVSEGDEETVAEGEEQVDESADAEVNEQEEIEEAFDLDALLEELDNLDETCSTDDEVNEGEDLDEAKEEVEESANQELEEVKAELEETQKAYNIIRTELNEVNLLNSKLLYVNRIFKANQLDESQKLRVVESLDKAECTKEAKLIYETIKDSFSIAKTKRVPKQKSLKEGLGMASKAVGKSTAPKRAIIAESDEMVSRFQKLANIKINQ